MNKKHIAQLKRCSREDAQQVRSFVGIVKNVTLTKRKINRGSSAVFMIDFTRQNDGMLLKLLVPYSLKHRCISEISINDKLNVELRSMSPDGGYRRSSNEFALIDYQVLKVS